MRWSFFREAVVSDIVISSEQLEEARNLICQYLRDAGYKGSLEDGTGIADAVIKPAALITLFIRQELNKARAYQSLKQAEALRPELDTDEYDAAVDAILSNWFVSRKAGEPGSGLIRLWFRQPVEFLRIQTGQSVGTVEAEGLVAAEDVVLSPGSFSTMRTTLSSSPEYYVDIRVRTVNNTELVISAGAQVTADIADIYFLRATIPADFSVGIPKESSEDFIARSKWAITTRELISEHAIRTVLLDEFDEIRSLYVARHGSAEQRRDLVVFEDVTIHVGNKADIYVSLPISRFTVTLTAGENGELDTSSFPVQVPVVDFFGARTEEGEVKLTVSADPLLWASMRFALKGLAVPPEYAGKEITVEWAGAPALRSIHDYVTSDSQRVSCYDPLVRHKHLVRFSVELSVDFVDVEDDEPHRAAVRETVAGYINSLVDGAVWTESEMVRRIHQLGYVSRVSVPVICKAEMLNTESGDFSTSLVSDRFDLADVLPESPPQISINTVQPYTDAAMIKVNGAAG